MYEIIFWAVNFNKYIHRPERDDPELNNRKMIHYNNEIHDP